MNENLKEKLLKLWNVIKKWTVKAAKAVFAYMKVAKLELIVIAAVIAVDLISKAIVGANMDFYDSVPLIPNFLNITYIPNKGAAFGSSFGLDKLLGPTGAMVVLIVITFLALGFFCFFLYRNRGKHKLCVLAYALIIGGAFGNLVDRMAFGYVRDFVEFVYFGLEFCGSKSFAIFNIADSALVIGVIIFAIYYIVIYREPEKTPKEKALKKSESTVVSETNVIGSAENTDENEEFDSVIYDDDTDDFYDPTNAVKKDDKAVEIDKANEIDQTNENPINTNETKDNDRK